MGFNWSPSNTPISSLEDPSNSKFHVSVVFFILKVHPRSLTASLALKNDGLKISPFLLGWLIFRGELLNFQGVSESGSLNLWKPKRSLNLILLFGQAMKLLPKLSFQSCMGSPYTVFQHHQFRCHVFTPFKKTPTHTGHFEMAPRVFQTEMLMLPKGGQQISAGTWLPPAGAVQNFGDTFDSQAFNFTEEWKEFALSASVTSTNMALATCQFGSLVAGKNDTKIIGWMVEDFFRFLHPSRFHWEIFRVNGVFLLQWVRLHESIAALVRFFFKWSMLLVHIIRTPFS